MRVNFNNRGVGRHLVWAPHSTNGMVLRYNCKLHLCSWDGGFGRRLQSLCWQTICCCVGNWLFVVVNSSRHPLLLFFFLFYIVQRKALSLLYDYIWLRGSEQVTFAAPLIKLSLSWLIFMKTIFYCSGFASIDYRSESIKRPDVRRCLCCFHLAVPLPPSLIYQMHILFDMENVFVIIINCILLFIYRMERVLSFRIRRSLPVKYCHRITNITIWPVLFDNWTCVSVDIYSSSKSWTIDGICGGACWCSCMSWLIFFFSSTSVLFGQRFAVVHSTAFVDLWVAHKGIQFHDLENW